MKGNIVFRSPKSRRGIQNGFEIQKRYGINQGKYSVVDQKCFRNCNEFQLYLSMAKLKWLIATASKE